MELCLKVRLSNDHHFNFDHLLSNSTLLSYLSYLKPVSLCLSTFEMAKPKKLRQSNQVDPRISKFVLPIGATVGD